MNWLDSVFDWVADSTYGPATGYLCMVAAVSAFVWLGTMGKRQP